MTTHRSDRGKDGGTRLDDLSTLEPATNTEEAESVVEVAQVADFAVTAADAEFAAGLAAMMRRTPRVGPL